MPGPDVLRRGVNPLGVLDELRELGETTITTDPDLVPPLEQLDPERCYLTWTIQVKTAASPERLSEAFLFFAEDSALSISRLRADGKLVPVRPGRRRRWRRLHGGTSASGFEKPRGRGASRGAKANRSSGREVAPRGSSRRRARWTRSERGVA